jgi:hypothetical protein
MKKWASRIRQGAACATVIGALLFPVSGNAAAFFYHFDDVFSGTAPANTAPWVNALFQDVSPGTVLLTVSNPSLASSEFVGSMYFNLNPGLNANNLTFTQTATSGGFSNPTISTGTDSFKADGDGFYDILFNFSTVNGSTFSAGESFTYKITGIPTLNVNDFNFLSLSSGGHGPFDAAAHVQGIASGDGSGWVDPHTGITPAPEPQSIMIFAAAIGLWAFRGFAGIRPKNAAK